MTTSKGTRTDINAALRAQKALQMRHLGHTYDRIAEVCGYGDRGSAFRAVQREIKRTITPVAEDVRELELSRLDQLLTVFYAKAMKGDGWSLDRVLRIMERRSAYLGLDAPANVNVTADVTNLGVTVVLEQMRNDPNVIEAANRFLGLAAGAANTR